jgi:hypothetical protein
MAAGLRALGHEPELVYGTHSPVQHVACWGWRLGFQLRQRGHEVLCMERGYIGDRFAWTSLAWNGLNGRGTFAPTPDDGGARFRQHHAPLKPWRDPGAGGYALIAGQVPGDASLRGRDLWPWYHDRADEARSAGYEPVFRPHPVAVARGHRHCPNDMRQHHGTLEDALAGAAVVITYNSNTGVDALLAGVPVVADNEGSMAWPLASTDVRNLVRPDRTEWAHALAWKQWQMSELADGTALRGYL